VRQEGRYGLSGGRQGAYAAVLTPSLKNPKIASVGPPRGYGSLLPRPIGGAREIGRQRGRQGHSERGYDGVHW
jgi:hypothetical protein